MTNIAALSVMIRSARYCIALSGAGVSTLSGIPDFRGKNGIYSGGGASDGASVDAAEKMFDIAYFEKDSSIFYQAAASLIYNIDEKEPSIVHNCLAELERQGFLKSVITQNIDGLHQKAGNRRVIELHGSPAIHYCLRCPGVRMGFPEAAARVKAGDMPRCPHCGSVLKPAITFFGETLPMNARREAEEEAQSADLMLVLGTSLSVFPAADLPRTVIRRGGKIVIVNDTVTHLDGNASLRLGDLKEVFTGLAKQFASKII
jgi:NAD-dependent deacetylase